MRARVMCLTAMLAVAAGAAVLWAAPPAKNLAATATFRDAGDAVTSQPITGTINSIGAFSGIVASPATPGTQVSVTLPPMEPGTRECELATLAGCSEFPQPSGMALALDRFQVGVKPLVNPDPDNPEWDDLPGGLTGMACNPTPASPTFALVNYTLYINGTDGHWGLNANPRYHADAATVVRRSKTEWIVTAVGRAELIGFGHSGLLRKGAGPSHEGQYVLPFEITIETAIGSTSCPS